MGNELLIKEATRQTWGWGWLEMLIQDLRFAMRWLRKTPGFTMAVVATLALGIGANTAIFSVVNTVLLQPLTYPDPERLVQIVRNGPQGNSTALALPEVEAAREQASLFTDIAAYDYFGPAVNLTGDGEPEQVKAIHVSAEYFRLFGAPVALGRAFTAEEDRPGGGHFAVIGHDLWLRRFGGAASIVGQAIVLGGSPYVVVGVLGPGFTSDPKAEIWLPLQADPNSSNQAHVLVAAAHLKPDITLEMVKAQLKLATVHFREKYPAFNSQVIFSAEMLRDSVVENVRRALLVLLGAVACVLLIACSNVANLLMARAATRRREMAIRSSIGAGRGRIMRQLLTESLLLSITGGTVGLGLGYLGVRALLLINPGNIPRIGEKGTAVTLDWRVLLFTLGISVATGVLFGLIPAFNASRTDLSSAIKESASRAGSGLRQNKARSVLVITEVMLALVLLVGAALLLRTFAALRTVNPGIDMQNILTMEMSLAGTPFEKTAGAAQLDRDAERRIENLPGVVAAASTWLLPLEGNSGLSFAIEGRPLTNGPTHGGAGFRAISPHYFGVFGIPLLRGRLFNDRDDSRSPGVVVIDETMAKQFWPRGDALGQRVTIGRYDNPEFAEPPRQIIGIVGDVRDRGLSRLPTAMMYMPQSQIRDAITTLNASVSPITWAIRTKVEPYSLTTSIQRELREASAGLPVSRIRSMGRVAVQSTAGSDFNLILLLTFAALAVLLAAVGIYGLMAYSVQQRTQEIGIRIALGAGIRDVRNMIVFQGMRLALIGIALGIFVALGVTRLMASLVFGVKTTDPIVFMAGATLLGGVALIAAYVPARRASRIDPLDALRHE